MDWPPKNRTGLSVDVVKVQIRDCIRSLKNLSRSIRRGHGVGTHGFTMMRPSSGVKVTVGMDHGSYGQLSDSARYAKERRAIGGNNGIQW
ncbi:hypothetical protein N7445_002131 [Penicillium cf. griseofulvum]|nr:hypothetical protein N7445_002131 [Penicillium cf. griseofulvum]